MAITYSMLSLSTTIYALGFVLIWKCFKIWYDYRSIPGPPLAAFTNFVRLFWTWRNQSFNKYIELHRKYGKIVRIGPNVFSLDDPNEIPAIYGHNYDYAKSDFYRTITPYVNGVPLPGGIRPMPAEEHKKSKEAPLRIFSNTNMLQFEDFIDNTIDHLLMRINELFLDGNICDLTLWMNLFAYDNIGELTFSSKYGLLDAGTDFNHIIRDNEAHFDRISLIGQIPWYDLTLGITPWQSRLFKQAENPLFTFLMQQLGKRQAMAEKEELLPSLASRDLLTQFTRAEQADPALPPGTFIQWCMGNVAAGAGTTANELTVLIGNIVKSPSTYVKLMNELNAANLSKPASWTQVQHLPYLDACIKEAERLCPGTGLLLEREVPSPGAVVSGHYLKGGTIVGINPWVIGRNKEVFGADSDEWRPERWLTVDTAERRRMENAVLTFGGGSRRCYGVALARLVIAKTAATLFSTYKIKIVGEEDWRSEGRWFTHQSNAFVTFEKLR